MTDPGYPPGYYGKAEQLVAEARRYLGQEGGKDTAAVLAPVAQVHATLAVAEAIEAALARLEAIARDKGVAIGVASALPPSIAIIGRFARALEARGIALIPISAAMPSQQPGLTIGSSTVR